MTELPYNEMKAQLEREVETYLKNVPETAMRASRPEINYQKGVVTVSFTVPDFTKGSIIDVLDVLKSYYTKFSEINPIFVGQYMITAELERGWITGAKNEKTNRTTIGFELNAYGKDYLTRTNKVTFSKETVFRGDEVDCIAKVWKGYAVRESAHPQDLKTGPKEKLEEIGAVFYEPSTGFSWNRIAGYTTAKEELKNTIVLPFMNPEVYKKIAELTRKDTGSNIPRAVLLQGPPGTGKTTFARIIASESGVPLIYVPIESIMSMWYGNSEKRLASIFDESSKLEKSIIFLDEIDSLATSRDANMHEATRRVLSVLLRKMQGIVSAENVMTLGATNKPEHLDSALVSRFNRSITIGLPTPDERKLIFSHYAKQLGPDDLEKLASATEKASGRDIEDICSDAERTWGAQLITQGKTEATAPEAQAYFTAAQAKNPKTTVSS